MSISGLIFSKSAFGGMTPFSKITIVTHREPLATFTSRKSLEDGAYENSHVDLTMLAKALAPSRWPIFALTDPLQRCQPLNFCGTPRARSDRLPTHKGAPRLIEPSGIHGLWLSSQSDHPLAFRFLVAGSSTLFVRDEGNGILAVGLNIASLIQREVRLLVDVAHEILLGLGTRLGQHWATPVLV